MFQSCDQQTGLLQERQTARKEVKDGLKPELCTSGILTKYILLNDGLERVPGLKLFFNSPDCAIIFLLQFHIILGSSFLCCILFPGTLHMSSQFLTLDSVSRKLDHFQFQ